MISAFLAPLIASAQVPSGQKNLAYIIDLIIGYLNQALVLLIGLAVVIFVWYVIQYFIKPNEERTKAAEYVMYSLIGFFVILSFWGLVNILQNTFGLKNEQNAPASWTSFKNIFPGGSGGSSSGGSTNYNWSVEPVNSYNPYGQEYNPANGANSTVAKPSSGANGTVSKPTTSGGNGTVKKSSNYSTYTDPYGQEYDPSAQPTDPYGQEYNPSTQQNSSPTQTTTRPAWMDGGF